MASPRVLILRAAGTNCDRETAFAWEQTGARPERVHIRQLADEPRKLDAYQILTIPGGFSYGDDIAAGRILAVQLQRYLADALRTFVDAGKLVLGICNGFQVLARAGLLTPTDDAGRPTCTVAGNRPAGFQDRWVHLRAATDRCVFLDANRRYEMPIANGEGRVAFANDAALQKTLADGQGALVYAAPPDGPHPAGLPDNPNGSAADLAGLCDATGRVLGLMPHPERFITATQHPAWTSRGADGPGDGLALFQKATAYFA